jgi:hypothetical protein
MRMTDHDPRQDCRVIPFVRPANNVDNVVTSSIAAVIAVTILHHEGESPEERLLEIIEHPVRPRFLILLMCWKNLKRLVMRQCHLTTQQMTINI